VGSELRLILSEVYCRLLAQVTRMMSQEAGTRLTTVQVFEKLLVDWTTQAQEFPGAEAVLAEIRKDIEAQRELEQARVGPGL